MTGRVLVAGIGNIFLGDDGFGPEVVRRLPVHQMGQGVRVTDYGIRGMHLAYDLLDGWDALVMVDAVPNHGMPGSVTVRRISAGHPSTSSPALDSHAMHPGAVVASLEALGGSLPPTLLVACEVADTAEGIGLSAPVRAAVEPAVERIEELIRELLADSSHRVTAGRGATEGRGATAGRAG